MALTIPREMQKSLSPRTRTDLAEQSDEKQQMFADLYKKKARSKGTMIAFSILFPIQLFFLGKIGLAVFFILTCGGFGAWYIIEWFLTPGRVDKYNEALGEELLSEIKIS